MGKKVSELKKAIILLSGGIDSATTMAIAANSGFGLNALSFKYGQRNQFELKAAADIATFLNAENHIILDIDLSRFGGSALTGEGHVPKNNENPPEKKEQIPVTYVPARNTVFLSLALAWGEAVCAFDIFIGVNALDYSGYPDCRPGFISAFEKIANLGTRAGIESGSFKIHAPLIQMTKAEIIQKGIELGLDYGLTRSCYDPVSENTACGRCDSCVLRKKGFKEAGVSDPTHYAH
jgi:7-cyano-7-deazaguanine synthase